MNFADTNWLEAMYFAPLDDDPEGQKRRRLVERFGRMHGQRLGVCALVYCEARNVFSRIARQPEPPEWAELEADKGGLLFVDPLDWDLTRRDAFTLFARYSHRIPLGTLDAAILAASRLGGAERLLTFDDTLAAVAVAEGLEVFPPLTDKGEALLARARSSLPPAPPNRKGRSVR
ncbi:MAG: type II toxin-antitoxin system VapC family toxin [Limisphaerales bacterium]